MSAGFYTNFLPVIVFVIYGVATFIFVRLLLNWNLKSGAPRLTVNAIVVSKREELVYQHHPELHHTMNTMEHYVTFQVESGDRMELHVAEGEFHTLYESDYGKLTFQGKKYLSFNRVR